MDFIRRWPATRSALAMSATVLVCGPLGGCAPPSGFRPGGESTVVIRTVGDPYRLFIQGPHRRVTVAATITNVSRQAVYLVHPCPHGDSYLEKLEKLVDGQWVFAWAPAVCLLDERPPVRLKPGRAFRDTAIAYQVGPHPPRFAVQPVPGTYRAVYYVARKPAPGLGASSSPALLPVSARTSNPFVIEAVGGRQRNVRRTHAPRTRMADRRCRADISKMPDVGSVFDRPVSSRTRASNSSACFSARPTTGRLSKSGRAPPHNVHSTA